MGNIASAKDKTNVVGLNLSNIPNSMSLDDLKRNLSEFGVIELDGTHDVTTGKYIRQANLKIRVKNNDESSLYNKLNKIGIYYTPEKTRATGKRDSIEDTAKYKNWENVKKTYSPIKKYDCNKHAKMGHLESQLELGDSKVGKWDNKWENLIHNDG